MRDRVLFIVSLAIIILSSWANIDYFGTSHTNMFSPVVNQSVHLLAFFLTAGLGYINWRNKDKWINNLWLGVYALALAIFAISIIIFKFTGSEFVKHLGIVFRNKFTEPLPFLVFFLFVQITKRFSKRVEG